MNRQLVVAGTTLAAGALGAVAAGGYGAVAAAGALGAVALLAGRLALPGASRTPPAPPHSTPAGPGFPTFRRIRLDLSWAGTSARYHHAVVRPLLARLVAARLAEHHRVDPATDPGRARALAGADLWALLDPDLPAPTGHDRAPDIGPDIDTLERLVDSVERL